MTKWKTRNQMKNAKLTLASSSWPTFRKAMYCLTPSMRFWNSTRDTFILEIIEPMLPKMSRRDKPKASLSIVFIFCLLHSIISEVYNRRLNKKVMLSFLLIYFVAFYLIYAMEMTCDFMWWPKICTLIKLMNVNFDIKLYTKREEEKKTTKKREKSMRILIKERNILPTIVAKIRTPAKKSATTNRYSISFSGVGVSPIVVKVNVDQ